MTMNGAQSGGGPPPSNPAQPSASALPTIPEVTLQRELARGGMGIVYRGRQDFLERDVAVKLLSPQLNGEKFAARFRREAKLLAGVKHPHIVACYAAGVTPEGQHYLVMELVEGPNLAEWIAEHGPVPARSALRIVRLLTSALAHACDLGVIHRDIKTANILLEGSTGTIVDPLFPFAPKLVDLGLARMVAAGTDPAQTAPGVVMGTPSTMAPEQFDAPDDVDFHVDIYGLGCVLYEMLTGTPAYSAQKLTDLVVAKRQPRGPDPCVRNTAIAAPIGKLVEAMLAQDPKDRPADYRALRAELDVLAKLPAQEPRAPAPAPARPAPAPNLLQTAEFEFLAAGHDAAKPGAGASGDEFTSRVVPPTSASPPPPPPPPPPAQSPPKPAPKAAAASTPQATPPPKAAAPAVPPSAPPPPPRQAPQAAPQQTPRPAPAWVAVAPVRVRARITDAQRRRRQLQALGVAAALLALAALPLLRRKDDAAAAPLHTPAPAPAAAPAPGASTDNRRPQAEVSGLDGELRRGTRIVLRSSATDPEGDELRYEWSVRPAGAATLSTPGDASTALRHDLLPGDTLTVALAVSDAGGSAVVERAATVSYAPENLLANFLAADSSWQPASRARAAWRQRDDGAVLANADELPCLRTRALAGPVWRVGGRLVPERAEARRGQAGFAQTAVCVRVAPQRQLAILCTRDGASGERWSASLQEVGRDDGRAGLALRPLLDAGKRAIARDATGPVGGASFTITRRGNELRFEFGFANGERVEHVETLRGEAGDSSLSLFVRGGRAAFPELSLW